MIKYLYSQHDEKADFFNHPMVSEIEPKSFVVNITRSIKLCRDPKQLLSLADCKLMFLGTFDDETGVFDVKKPQLLLECDKLIESTGLLHGNEGNKTNN